MTFAASPDVNLQIFYSSLPECSVIESSRAAADEVARTLSHTQTSVHSLTHSLTHSLNHSLLPWQCFKVSPMAISRLRRLLHKCGCSRMIITSLIAYLEDDEVRCCHPSICLGCCMLRVSEADSRCTHSKDDLDTCISATPSVSATTAQAYACEVRRVGLS